MTSNTLLWQLSEALFHVWDMHLYLDTHPQDEKIAQLSEKYMCLAQKLAEEYVSLCGPISVGDCDAEAWIKTPWPWDNARGNC